MAATARHAVAYMIGSIFKHIIDCVQLYFSNGFDFLTRKAWKSLVDLQIDEIKHFERQIAKKRKAD